MIEYGVDINSKIVCKDNTLFVELLEDGIKKTNGGILLPEEKFGGNGEYIHPRWAKVLFKADNIKSFEVGDWVLLAYGRWSTSILANINGESKEIWYVNPKSFKEIIGISKTKPKSLEQYV